MKTKKQRSKITHENVNDFLTELYLRVKAGSKFSVTKLGQDYNLRDGRLLDFLQDVNIIKNTGGIGNHAKWIWNTTSIPGDLMTETFIELFKTYKYNETKAAKKNPAVLLQYTALDEPQQPNLMMHSVTLTTEVEKRLAQIDFFVARSLVKQDRIWNNQERIQDRLKTILDNQNRYSLALRTGNITIETPILFGLIKLKSTIKIKTE